MDHNLPSLSSTYAEFVSLLDERLDDITVGLDPAVTVSAPTNLKIGAIRWLASESKWQKYAGGTTWNDLAATYAISISGSSANTATLSGLSLANTEGGTGPAWNTVPRISTAGQVDIGGSLDFHNTASDSSDYSVRLSTNNTTTDLHITSQGGSATKVLTVSNILGSSVSISGNAGTVTNGVYTTGTQTISGAKTFTSNITVSNANINTTGNITLDATSTERNFGWTLTGKSVYLFARDSDDLVGLYDSSIASTRWYSDASGNFVATGNITAFSDETVKSDWLNLSTDFISNLASLKSGTYTRLDTGTRQVGVGAQSLQKFMPEAVMYSNGLLSVAYGNAALVSAVELAKEVLKLKEEINVLKQLIQSK